MLSAIPVFGQHNLGVMAGLNFADLDMSIHADGRTVFGFGGLVGSPDPTAYSQYIISIRKVVRSGDLTTRIAQIKSGPWGPPGYQHDRTFPGRIVYANNVILYSR